jgi:hypothetical protein
VFLLLSQAASDLGFGPRRPVAFFRTELFGAGHANPSATPTVQAIAIIKPLACLNPSGHTAEIVEPTRLDPQRTRL